MEKPLFKPLNQQELTTSFITSPFGPRNRPKTMTGRGSSNHQGLDLRFKQGSSLYSPFDGKVVFSGDKGGFGNFVQVQNPKTGQVASFAHLDGLGVKTGDTIKPGDFLGTTGKTGNVSGPSLHFELSKDGKKIDPTDFYRKNEGIIKGQAMAQTNKPLWKPLNIRPQQPQKVEHRGSIGQINQPTEIRPGLQLKSSNILGNVLTNPRQELLNKVAEEQTLGPIKGRQALQEKVDLEKAIGPIKGAQKLKDQEAKITADIQGEINRKTQLPLSAADAKTYTIGVGGVVDVADLRDKIRGGSSLLFPQLHDIDTDNIIKNLTDRIGRLRSGGAINSDELKTFSGFIPSASDLILDKAGSLKKLNRLGREFRLLSTSMVTEEKYKKTLRDFKTPLMGEDTPTKGTKQPKVSIQEMSVQDLRAAIKAAKQELGRE